LWTWYTEGNYEEYHPEHETNMHEYGLSFDWVAPETFTDQREGYYRYQISWGGPSDEFRFYISGVNRWGHPYVYRVEYWFLDWFDGAHKVLTGEDETLLETIFSDFFAEVGMCEKHKEYV
jgi:hypothetical protein